MAELRNMYCTVTVHDEGRLTFQGFGEDLNVDFGGDPLILTSIERLAEWVERGEHCTREDLELLGRYLYRYMFGGTESVLHRRLDAALRGLNGGEYKDFRLRLTLAFEPKASRLASFPWEFLYVEHEGGFFFSAPSSATQLVLTRIVPPPAKLADSLEPKDGPLRILVAVCSPTGESLAKVSADRLLLPRLRSLRRDGVVDLRVLANPRYETIQKAFRPTKATEWWPHIFHFIGHGDVRGNGGIVAIRCSEEEQRLRWAGRSEPAEAPDVDWIRTSKLIELFTGHLPRLVFLHACRGAKAESSFRSFASGAEEFVQQGASAAIAMRYDIGSEDAELFAEHFYQQLSAGSPVDDAVTAARIRLAMAAAPNSWGDRRFGTPLLFLQSKQAVLLRPVAGQHDGGPRERDASGDEESFYCPYKLDPARKCKRPIARSLGDACPACRGKLLWCSKGHPCMAGDRQCATCREILSEAAPKRRLVGVSSFAG